MKIPLEVQYHCLLIYIILPKLQDFKHLLLPVITYYNNVFADAFLLMAINT